MCQLLRTGSSVAKDSTKNTQPRGRPHVRTDSTAPAAVLVKGHPDAVWTAATHRDTDVRHTPGRSRSRLHRVRHTITATNSLCLITRKRSGPSVEESPLHTKPDTCARACARGFAVRIGAQTEKKRPTATTQSRAGRMIYDSYSYTHLTRHRADTTRSRVHVYSSTVV